MRKLFLVAIYMSSLKSMGQIQSWPPGGQQPSPYILLLPDNRFVPSSKRYNLIWADQLFGLPTGQTAFVAKNYTGTQKIFDFQASGFRVFNSNFMVLAYHLALGLNPQHNDDCPDPKTNHGSGYIGVVAPAGYVSEWNTYFLPWLSSNAIAIGSNRYEQMFQHYDVIDTAHRVWHTDPQWLMNADNLDWRTYMGDECVGWMSGNKNEGCFLDVSVETMTGGLYHPNQSDPVPYNFNWYITPHGPAGFTITSLSDFANYMNGRYLDYYHSLYSRFHSAVTDYLAIPNVDQMTTGWYDPTWLDGSGGETVDGAMMESFGNATSSDMYLSLERGLRHLTGRGKILIAQFYNNSQPERYRRTGMYMLIKNENSFLNIVDGTVNWFPEYEIDLGDQGPIPANISSLRVSGSGSNSLFKRDYANGMVLCNTGTSTMTYSISGAGWNKVVANGGGAVDTSGKIASQNIQLIPVSGTVTVNASDCIILKNTSMTAVSDLLSPEKDFIVAENLTTGEITVKIHSWNDGYIKLELVDINGRIIRNIFSGVLTSAENEFKTDMTGLANGVYIIRCTGEINQSRRVIKF